MIITIDGKAATKKSPVAYILSNKLGYKHINSGLVYRALAVEVLERKKNGNPPRLSKMAWIVSDMRFTSDKMEWLGSSIERHAHGDTTRVTKYVEQELTSPATTLCASKLSVYPIVREAVEKCLRDQIIESDVVTDGRDMGTVVFPDADVKFFFESDFESRVGWRHKYEGSEYGESKDSVSKALKDRDSDSSWVVPADNANIIDVSKMDVYQIADKLCDCFVTPTKVYRSGIVMTSVPPCSNCNQVCGMAR